MTWSCRLETFSTGDGSSGSMATRRGLAGRAALHWWHSSRLRRIQDVGFGIAGLMARSQHAP